MRPHEELVGMEHERLREMAPTATHQHRKGGLYRDMGIAQDADTKEAYRDPRGPLRGWLHVHPYEERLLLRPASEDDKFTRIRDD